MAFLHPPGSGFARAFRILVILHTLAAVPAFGKVLLIVEDSASIYERAARGFLLGFASADAVETISLIDEGALRDRKLVNVKGSSAQLVVAIGTKAAVAARTNFPGVPLLYCLALNPGRHALTGTNIGGLALDIGVGQQMAGIQRALPAVTRIGVIYDEPVSGRAVREARAYLNPGVKLIARDVRNAAQAAQAIEELAGNVDAFWLLWDPVIANTANFRKLVEFSLRHKVALISPATPFVEAGALMSISADYFETGKRAGELAREIRQGKLSIGDISIQAPAGPVITLNSEVARRLGIAFPPGFEAEVLAP
jgi:putative tryptophan/tyrosine transport system substrate-binding protein